MKDAVKGTISGAFSAFFYGLNPLFALPLYARGMRPESVLLYCYLFALFLLGIPMVFRGKTFRLRKALIFPVLLCGLLMGCSALLMFLAYSVMDAGIAATLFFIYPVFVASVMCGFFHERLSWATVSGIAGALGGIALLHMGGSGHSMNPAGMALSLGSALCYTFYMIAIRESPVRELSPDTLTFYSILFSVPVFLAAAYFGQGIQKISSPVVAGLTVGLALFSLVFPYLLLTVAVRLSGPTKTAILGALEPLTAVFLSVLLFGGVLTMRAVCGILLILLSVLLVITAGDILSFAENIFHRLKTVLRKR